MKRINCCMVLLLAALPLAGCVANESAPDSALPTSAESELPPEWTEAPWTSGEWHGCESNAGTYWVEWRALGEWVDEGEFPLNEDFEIELRLFDAATRERKPIDVDLQVTARMPTHGHGMKHDTRVHEQADGGLLVQGMLLHMTGPWELYFDIRRAARTERAQVAFEME